jgi:F-type H+-transporting ATPase subunit delta
MEGLIISAFELNDKKVKKIEEKFSAHIGQEVTLKQEVDKSLLGGFVVHIRSHLYDYSIKRRLEEMKKYLVQES